MYSFVCRNVNEAYDTVVPYVLNYGGEAPSRNGKVIFLEEPVSICYERPLERVLFDPNRDANPFFHLMEAIWMLAGSKAADWPVQFNKQMAEYANDDGEYDGAYGYRWRKHFGFDQIQYVAELLRNDPTTRRAVIAMYDPRQEKAGSKDVPCNTHIYFMVRGGVLDMTVMNRSNDAVWGAFGANAVHMSVLLEVVAALARQNVGRYWQITNNLHIYTEIPKVMDAVNNLVQDDRYQKSKLQPFPLVKAPDSFLLECERFVKQPWDTHWQNPFFYYVARPMYMAWKAYKNGSFSEAASWASQIEDDAWSIACTNWLMRRKK